QQLMTRTLSTAMRCEPPAFRIAMYPVDPFLRSGRTLLLAASLLWTSVGAAWAQQGDTASEGGFRAELVMPLQQEHVHGSTIVELPGGDLLVAWFQGSGERWADDVRIMGTWRPAGSEEWSEPFVLADVDGFPDINPVLFVDAEERLWLLWYTVIANQWETSLLKYRISEDYRDRPGAPEWKWQADLHVKPGGSAERGIQPDDPFVLSVREQAEAYAATAEGVGSAE